MIKEIKYIHQILPEIDCESMVLFDLDDTLIEPSTMLGGKAWRRYARNVLKKVKPEEEVTRIHDRMTYHIAKRVPYVAIEEGAHDYWMVLQKHQIPVFGFTARGRQHWYDMPTSDGEELAVEHLRQAGFDLNSWGEPVHDALFSHPSYAQRIFFTYPLKDKGEFVLHLFTQVRFRHTKVVFIDDKEETVHSVDKAFWQLRIPSVCFYYRHVDLFRPFDPMIANIQLEKLFFENIVLSNEEAALLKEEYIDKNPDDFFLELVSRLSLRKYQETET